MIPATTDSIKKKYTICGIRCPNVTIKNMKCTKKKKVGRFLFRKKKKKKSNHEKKLMRIQRSIKAMRKKYLALLKFMSSSLCLCVFYVV